ncbi:serine/threonine protein kinase [Actinomadura barringtoniae]|uniref:Serine/threonine protein kinase n=1 Tax=Actinomadura barringtoniae TaxID=1427535 RepID=A0A939T7G6_9ACTN|nr:serine/threonine-protein kinase [Actinomadura barringtoniae]MBO2453098.1 serine/threonine protein kinase [Actinomadura barringtoniae]
MDPLRAGDPAGIGDYVLLARLGAGGMGEVFLGRSPGGRLVAVKRVHESYAADPEFRRRFKREVEAARTVGGFHTAPVVDADPDAERPWMVTAYVAGPSLAEALAEHGALPAMTLRALGAGLAEALQAIHAQNLIHRDLKPSNILLAADGPRVIDFGIARAADASGVTARAGTPGFMSPELLAGRDLTPACDVFALGLILAYAAGVRPYGEGPAAALDYRVVHQEPDLTGLDPGLTGLVSECLAREPAARPTPAALLATLSEGSDFGAWLPADLQTMIATRVVATEEPVTGGLQAESVVFQTTSLRDLAGEVGLVLLFLALGTACFFPRLVNSSLPEPNSFSPHPDWRALIAGTLFTVLALGGLFGILQFQGYRRRLEITPVGLSVTVGNEHHDYRWAEITKITLMDRMAVYYLRQACLYARPAPDIAARLASADSPPTRHADPARGWVLVCRIDEFGAHRQVILNTLARHAGAAWEPPPPGRLPYARSEGSWPMVSQSPGAGRGS